MDMMAEPIAQRMANAKRLSSGRIMSVHMELYCWLLLSLLLL